LSMTTKLMSENVNQCSKEDIAMPWIFKRKAEEVGYRQLTRNCLDSAARDYARRLSKKRYRSAAAAMSWEEFEDSLIRNTEKQTEREYVRPRVYCYVADEYYWQGENALAREFYCRALKKAFWVPKTWVKWLLASSGSVGHALRRARANLAK
jgi:hypothetical protein